jgi:mannosyltransferase
MLVLRTRTWLIFVLLLAALLRLAFLTREGFWFDEFYTVKQSAMSLPELLTDLAHSDVHPPLHHVLMYGIRHLVGASELWFRLPSAIFGVLAVLMAYLLGGVLFERKVGLWAALMLAVNRFAVAFSQEARAYSLLIFLSGVVALAWWLFVTKPSRLKAALYILTAILLAYTHVYGLLFLTYLAVSFWVLPLLQNRLSPQEPNLFPCKRPLRTWLLVHLLILLGFAPWIPSMLMQVTRVQKAFWIKAPSSSFLVSYAGEYLGHPLVVLVLLLLVGLTVVKARQLRGPERIAVTLLFGWIVYLLALPYLVSQVSQPIMMAKYSISVLLPLVLLSARGLLLIHERSLQTGAVTLVVGLSFWWLFPTLYLTPNREQWKEMSASLLAGYDPGKDLVAYYDPSANQGFCYTYYLPQGLPVVAIQGSGERYRESLNRFRAAADQTGANRVWVMKMRVRQGIPEELLQGWRKTDTQAFNGGELCRLERATAR